MAAIDNIIATLLRSASPQQIELAGSTVYANQQERIFVEGRNSTGAGIGTYSKDAAYINPKRSPKDFKPVGKTGKSTFADGRPHTTKYFPGGYSQFRSSIGRNGTDVNLDLFGDLKKQYIFGFQGRNFVFGFANESAAKVAEGNEEHFKKGPIFNLTQEEHDLFGETLLEVWQ